jgi:hypothetical protein
LHNSGGNNPLSLNLSKWVLSIPSIPEGRLGNMPAGLFQTLCLSNQKHLGHSSINPKDEEDNLYDMNKRRNINF